MKKVTLLLFAGITALSLTFSSCSNDDDDNSTPTPAPSPTLYERVGGTEMVADPNNQGKMIEKGRLTLRAVVDSSITVIAADAQLAPYFQVLFMELGNNNTTGLMALSENLTDFFSTATGSKNPDYAYAGMNMKDAHDPAKNNRMGMKSNKADFDKFVADVGQGLAKNGVTAQTNKALVDDLVALLYTTENDIVQR